MSKDPKGIAFVVLQGLLFIIYLIPIFDFTIVCFPELKYVCFLFILIGLIIILGAILQLRNQLSPFPTPTKNGKLIQNGCYKISRHPIYTGILLMAFFYALYTCSGYRLIVFIALTALFYFKSAYEEKLLSQLFPEYKEYKKKVGRFGPWKM